MMFWKHMNRFWCKLARVVINIGGQEVKGEVTRHRKVTKIPFCYIVHISHPTHFGQTWQAHCRCLLACLDLYMYLLCLHLVTKVVNMMFWKQMHRFWCKLAQVVINIGGKEVKGRGHMIPKGYKNPFLLHISHLTHFGQTWQAHCRCLLALNILC